MQIIKSAAALAGIALLGLTSPSFAQTAFNPANAISLKADTPNSFHNFAPELPLMLDRFTPPNTEAGLRVDEIEPGLFAVTDLIYQSAFLVTDAGVVVFDAPHTLGERLRAEIEAKAPGIPITHLIMSHGHADHNGGGAAFADIPNLKIIASSAAAQTLKKHPLNGVPTPTQTFDDTLNLTVGGVEIQLKNTRFHAEDIDTLIYLPQQKFLMAIDLITPGEVPYMNFGSTTDIAAYIDGFDTVLAYDFNHFLAGHVSLLGNRDDVIASRDYTLDVRDTVFALMPEFLNLFGANFETMQFQNGNLAYRAAIESIRDECTGQMIERWGSTLSAVDIWAPSHCNKLIEYSIMH